MELCRGARADLYKQSKRILLSILHRIVLIRHSKRFLWLISCDRAFNRTTMLPGDFVMYNAILVRSRYKYLQDFCNATKLDPHGKSARFILRWFLTGNILVEM